ncbi:MAG: hypothetical protein Q7S55_01160 [Nanoarchaeota archaeon]|nr:hypothetical protein [Nanoarchaeota archaeon]
MKSQCMKIAMILVVALLLFSGLLIAGCAEPQEVSESSSSEPSDAEVLAQYPDHLDTALEELEMVG